jgi:hypothetical protein
MFSLDDKFLEEVGLASLPEEQKKPFLQHIYLQLERMVGERLSSGLTQEQTEEFEAIIDQREEVVKPWLQRYAPDYQTREDFAKMAQSMQQPPDSIGLLSEYAATRWLEVNRPDYRDVVAGTLQGIKNEIIANRDAILGGPAAEQTPQSQDSPPQPPVN